MKEKLTDKKLQNLPPAPPGKRYTIWDTEVGNFGVRVTDRVDPTTRRPRRTFVVMRRLHGRLIRHKVGTYPAITLAAAREAARDANLAFERGIDPRAKQKASALQRRRESTVNAVAADFAALHLSKLRSGAETKASIEREFVSRWGDRPIGEVSDEDIVRLLNELTRSGRPAAASKMLGHARKLFGWAAAQKIYGLKRSPVADLSASELLGKKVERDRVLSAAELRELWALTSGPAFVYPAGALVRFLLATGQRLREVSDARWDEIEVKDALWTIPASRYKTGSAHEVPLSSLAIEILASIPRFEGPYVFTTTAGERPISGFSKMKDRLDAALGEDFESWVFHDLRRTMRTRLSGLPIPHNVAELVIGHRQKGLHRTYDRHAYRAEKARAMELWCKELLSTASDEPLRSSPLSEPVDSRFLIAARSATL
jgi:integrase